MHTFRIVLMDWNAQSPDGVIGTCRRILVSGPSPPHTHTYTYTYTHMHARIRDRNMSPHTRLRSVATTHAHIHIHIHIHTHMHARIRLVPRRSHALRRASLLHAIPAKHFSSYIYIYIYTYIYIYVYVYHEILIHTSSHRYTHTHTHTPAEIASLGQTALWLDVISAKHGRPVTNAAGQTCALFLEFALEPPAVEAAVGSVPSPPYRLSVSPSPHKTVNSFSPSKVRTYVCMYVFAHVHLCARVCMYEL